MYFLVAKHAFSQCHPLPFEARKMVFRGRVGHVSQLERCLKANRCLRFGRKIASKRRSRSLFRVKTSHNFFTKISNTSYLSTSCPSAPLRHPATIPWPTPLPRLSGTPQHRQGASSPHRPPTSYNNRWGHIEKGGAKVWLATKNCLTLLRLKNSPLKSNQLTHSCQHTTRTR